MKYEPGFYMDGYLRSNLDKLKRVIRQDWDMTFVVDGMEGSGKSVFALQLASYVTNGKFSLDNVAFTPDEFKNKILSAEKYSAVVFDEALSGFMSRNAMGAINKALVQMMAEIRQRNLFIFIVLPSFFDLDRNIALWRSRGIFHIYTSENLQRGYFGFWSASKKKSLWVLGKKFYSYSKPVPSFKGRFTNAYPVDQSKYREMKLKALQDRKAKKKEETKELARDLLMYVLYKVCNKSQTQISNYLKDNGYIFSPTGISRAIKRLEADIKVNTLIFAEE